MSRLSTDDLRDLLVEQADSVGRPEGAARLVALRARRTASRRRSTGVAVLVLIAAIAAGWVGVVDRQSDPVEPAQPVDEEPPGPTLSPRPEPSPGGGLDGSPLDDPLSGARKVGEVSMLVQPGVTASSSGRVDDLAIGWAVSCPQDVEARWTLLVRGHEVMRGDCSVAYTRSGLLLPSPSDITGAEELWRSLGVAPGQNVEFGLRLDDVRAAQPPSGSVRAALYDGAPFVRPAQGAQSVSVSGRIAAVTDAHPDLFGGFAEAPDGSGDVAVLVEPGTDDAWEQAVVDAVGTHEGWQWVRTPVSVRGLESVGRQIAGLADLGGIPTFTGSLVQAVDGEILVYVSSEADRQVVRDALADVTVRTGSAEPVLDRVVFVD